MDYATRRRLILDSIIQERTFVAYVAKHNGDHFEAARDFYKSELQGRIVQTPIGPVRITGAGWRKFKGGARSDYLKAALVEHIEGVLRNGRYSNPESINKERQDDKMKFYFATSEVQLGERRMLVGLTVAEDRHGNLFYNINHAESSVWKSKSALDSTMQHGFVAGFRWEFGHPAPKSALGIRLVPAFEGCNLYIEAKYA